MAKPVTFESARNYFRQTRFDIVRAAVKRPFYASFALTCIIPAYIPFKLAPIFIPISVAYEGLRSAYQNLWVERGSRREYIRTKESGLISAAVLDLLQKNDANVAAAKLLASAGRGEKIFARRVLAEMQSTYDTTYRAVEGILSQSRKGCKLLGKETSLSRWLHDWKASISLRAAHPILKFGGIITAVDQFCKLSSLFPTVSDPEIKTLVYATLIAIVAGGYKLAKGRPWMQTGLGLMFWGGLSNLIDKLHGDAVINYIPISGIPHWPPMNIGDIAATLGAAILFISATRDK